MVLHHPEGVCFAIMTILSVHYPTYYMAADFKEINNLTQNIDLKTILSLLLMTFSSLLYVNHRMRNGVID